MAAETPFRTSSGPPASEFDVALLDLDGVVYLGSDPVPGAAAALAGARELGMGVAFVTNNASRTPDEVVALLDEVGVKAEVEEVVTSAQAAARMLTDRVPAGAKVLVVGSPALRREVTDRGFVPVATAEDEPLAVVCGFSRDIGWRELAEATVAVRGGAYWLATNADITLPSTRGPLPGNGTLVGVIAAATGLGPDVAGKPDPALHRESVERTGARRPIVVGDVLATDIEGANRAGCASMLVLSGVTTAVDLLVASPDHRPTFVAADVGGLLQAQPAVLSDNDGVRCGRWRVGPDAGSGPAMLRATVGPAQESDLLDALRASCVAVWAAAPGRSRTASVAEVTSALGAGDDDAAQMLAGWGLPPGR
jgi:HAD superfamily hydrolase (TIGR01450 family)